MRKIIRVVACAGALLLVSSTHAAAKKTISNCRDVKDPRDRAYCLLLTDDAAALPLLEAIGLEIFHRSPVFGIADGQNFFYASENAGVIAAKTTEAPLMKMATADDPGAQLFAISGLKHMLSILRMGYAKGGKVDDVRFSKVIPSVTAVCLEKLQAGIEAIEIKAAGCLGESRDIRYSLPLTERAGSAKTVKTRDAAFRAFLEIGASEEGKENEVMKQLAHALEKPLSNPWQAEEVSYLGSVCGFLASNAPKERWAQEPAKTALKNIREEFPGPRRL